MPQDFFAKLSSSLQIGALDNGVGRKGHSVMQAIVNQLRVIGGGVLCGAAFMGAALVLASLI